MAANKSSTAASLKNSRSKSNKRLSKFMTKSDAAASSKEDQKLGDSKIQQSKTTAKVTTLKQEEMTATIESSAAEEAVAPALMKTSASNPSLNLLTQHNEY